VNQKPFGYQHDVLTDLAASKVFSKKSLDILAVAKMGGGGGGGGYTELLLLSIFDCTVNMN